MDDFLLLNHDDHDDHDAINPEPEPSSPISTPTPTPTTTTTKYSELEDVDRLVMSGGGVFGIMFCGAATALEEIGILPKIHSFAGTSAGSIMAALLAATYTPAELSALMEETDLISIVDGFDWFREAAKKSATVHKISRIFGYIGVIKRTLLLPFTNGLFEGATFEKWLNHLLLKKLRHGGRRNIHSPTFQDLFLQTGNRLHIVATDLKTNYPLIYSTEETPHAKIASAVRASISVPGAFRPVHGMIVDGGVVENYPLYAWGETPEDMTRVIGLKLMTENPHQRQENLMPPPRRRHLHRQTKWSLFQYGCSIIDTWMAAVDRMYVEEMYWERTIPIQKPADISFLDFDLSLEEKQNLIHLGHEAVFQHMGHDFDDVTLL